MAWFIHGRDSCLLESHFLTIDTDLDNKLNFLSNYAVVHNFDQKKNHNPSMLSIYPATQYIRIHTHTNIWSASHSLVCIVYVQLQEHRGVFEEAWCVVVGSLWPARNLKDWTKFTTEIHEKTKTIPVELYVIWSSPSHCAPPNRRPDPQVWVYGRPTGDTRLTVYPSFYARM
jgi:hypothetical protein